MIILALFFLIISVGASVWTTAYALQDSLAALLWLQRERQWAAWWDTIESLHDQLDLLQAADTRLQLQAA